MRVLFLGNDTWSVPTLEALTAAADVDVELVITNPPRPAGRGSRLTSTAVADAARDLGVRLLEAEGVRDGDGRAAIHTIKPDALVVVAYGALLPPDVLDVPRLGTINLHFSLLPRWRGAAPVQRAILEGDETTGVSVMLLDEGLDTGPVLIDPGDADPTRRRFGKAGAAARRARCSPRRRDAARPGSGHGRGGPAGTRGSHLGGEAAVRGADDRLEASGGFDRQEGSRVRARARRDDDVQGCAAQGTPGRDARTRGSARATPQRRRCRARPRRCAAGDHIRWAGRPARGRPRRSHPHVRSGLGAGRAHRARGTLHVRQTARSVALEAIRRVTDEGAYSTIVVPGALRRSRLDERDRAFATGLAFGTIRHLLAIDWALDRVASRPVSRMSPSARTVLRLGAYQVLFTDVAQHAAVGETVGLAGDRERGFVNAVLRRLTGEPTVWPEGDGDADVAVRTGLAPWAVNELRRLLPTDEVEPAAAAFASPASLCLRANHRRDRARSRRSERCAMRGTIRGGLLSIRPVSCSTVATQPGCPATTKAGSPCRIRRRRSSSAPSTRNPAIGSSTPVPRREARPPTQPRSSGTPASSLAPTGMRGAWA